MRNKQKIAKQENQKKNQKSRLCGQISCFMTGSQIMHLLVRQRKTRSRASITVDSFCGIAANPIWVVRYLICFARRLQLVQLFTGERWIIGDAWCDSPSLTGWHLTRTCCLISRTEPWFPAKTAGDDCKHCNINEHLTRAAWRARWQYFCESQSSCGCYSCSIFSLEYFSFVLILKSKIRRRKLNVRICGYEIIVAVKAVKDLCGVFGSVCTFQPPLTIKRCTVDLNLIIS